jgi:hypothetical protein
VLTRRRGQRANGRYNRGGIPRKNDGMLCKLESNTEKDLSSAGWNVEKYCLDGVECGERPVEHRESSEGKPWNVEKKVSALRSQYVVCKTLITSGLRL